MSPACPYCRRRIAPNRLRAHTKVCLFNEATAQRVRSVLRRFAACGAMPSRDEYQRRLAGRSGMPSCNLLRRSIGRWADVARWCGVRPHAEMAMLVWGEARTVLVDLAYQLHDGEMGPSMAEWDTYRPAHLPSAEKLLRRFRTWSAVLGWGGGLEEGTPTYYAKRMALREKRRWQELAPKHAAEAALAKWEAQLLEEDRRNCDTLTVCEPRTVRMYDWTTRRWRQRTVAAVR